jgi:hypothetical protein
MIYGNNLLTTVPVDWTLANASMSAESLTIGPGGSATQEIPLGVLGTFPESVMVQIVASEYANAYEANMFVELRATTPDDKVYTYTIPIVDTGNGVCLVELPTEEIEHDLLTFSIRSDVEVTITDWFFSGPMATDVDLTEILDRIPRLLKDYNMDPITIGQEEECIIMISAYATDDTELTGLLVVSYVATEATILTLRIYDNDIEELYSPLIFNIAAGYGTVTIPHAYLNLLKGYHTFIATAQVDNGSLTMDTRKILYVIDGGRLVYSLADIGSRAYDMTIRKLESEFDPSFIYAVCIDDGKCLVKKAAYTQSPGAAWLTEASIGDAIDAAMEFDGSWVIDKNLFTFNTDEHPWIAWVAPDNTLYAKNLSSADTSRILSTDVLKVAMVKGWGVLPGQDQGMVVGYVKTDGSVYYVSYSLLLSGNKGWDYERPLSQFLGTALDINMFKTNDFRVGFNVLDADGTTHTYLTTRNWAGMSGVNETFYFGIAGITGNIAGIQELSYLKQDSEAFTFSADLVTNHSLLTTYNSGETPVTLNINALGFIYNEHTFVVAFNYPVTIIDINYTLRFLNAFNTLNVLSIEVIDKNIWITVSDTLDVESFTIKIPGGIMYVSDGRARRYYAGGTVTIYNTPFIEQEHTETLSFSISSITGTIGEISELTYSSYDSESEILLAFSVNSITAALSVQEVPPDEIIPV